MKFKIMICSYFLISLIMLLYALDAFSKQITYTRATGC